MRLSLGSFLPSMSRGWKNMRAVCGLPTCHNKMLMRSVPQSRIGITIGDSWYCGVDCFIVSARTRISALSRRRVMEMPRDPRLSIGLIMLSKNYLTDDQLRFAIVESERNGEKLEGTLIRLGIANEKQIAAARAAQWGYPFCGSDRVTEPIEAEIPTTLMQTYAAVPLHYAAAAKRLVLGFVYRVDHSFLQSLEQITGCRAEPCFITPSQFGEQMDHLAVTSGCEEAVVEDPGTPTQMARTLGGYASEIAAREASFAYCRNYIWARLAGKSRRIDLLFQLKNAADVRYVKNSVILDECVGSLG
ncbi:hypothetical protein HNQ77_002973 [Silvibacterium bohemicum]|uniref:Type II secretion system protein GspE N-terminal domain-containing protein n=1 Tax=Silvibacterium bohemicum TaxID=1577686 RepID=A0A841JX54_9BACT|nr:hypothetical protein [Silvibacterium bohemicum]MBB6145017.1 hypothetical protein [Silvibacterium bohemicum]